jgi:hypothetical protein
MYAGQCRRHSPARTTAVALLHSGGFCLVPQQPCSHQHGKQAHSSSQLPVWRPSLRRQGPGQRKNKLRSSEVDRSEENRNQRSGYSPRRSSGVVRLCEQPVDDCLAAHPLRFLIIFPSHPHLEKLVHELADGCGAQIAALSAREQEFGIAARDLEERRRPSEVVAARVTRARQTSRPVWHDRRRSCATSSYRTASQGPPRGLASAPQALARSR